jgi:hypothetical protein
VSGDDAGARDARERGRQLGLRRRLTAPLRTLPSFLVIGAQRSGTTTLWSYLLSTGKVRQPERKGIQYFTLHADRGPRWYRGNFPLARPGRDWITGEGSPYYLFHPRAPALAARVLPEARLVALLRNPVDRAYSHYHHELRMGAESLASFEEALAAEQERTAGEAERLLADPSYHSPAHRHFTYLARGRYAEQLERWLEHFPREQLLVLSSEELFGEPAAALARLHAFLRLPPPDGEPTLPHEHRASYPPMRPETRTRLLAYFCPHNERLFALLGRRFDWDR